jgi:hypothetical protein
MDKKLNSSIEEPNLLDNEEEEEIVEENHVKTQKSLNRSQSLLF